MTEQTKRLILEHQDLCYRIALLVTDIYEADNKDDKVDYANKCIQLKGMKMYAEALGARLCNSGIIIDGEDYFEHLNNTTPEKLSSPVEEIPTTENKVGSDYDKDGLTIKETDGKNDVTK